ncbi:MAG TPA: hypothetical protein VI072_29245 [Polyangiaceae bacterium]
MPRFLRLLTLPLLVLACTLAACSSNDTAGANDVGPLMRPGDDCLACHSANSGRNAPIWSAAGTVFPEPTSSQDEGLANVRVHLSAPDGSLLETLITNAAGNFYTSRPLPRGFQVALEYQGERIDMPCPPPGGLCNACHTLPPIGQAPGRIFIPQARDPSRPPFDCTDF